MSLNLHYQTSNYVQLGNRFIQCACGERFSGGVGDLIAERNYDYHVQQARQGKEDK